MVEVSMDDDNGVPVPIKGLSETPPAAYPDGSFEYTGDPHSFFKGLLIHMGNGDNPEEGGFYARITDVVATDEDQCTVYFVLVDEP